MTGAPLDADVIVAGGGPCGLMLANELGRRGVATLLFNDRPTTSPHPQANATQARTMEHYRRLGFADRVRRAGLPADYPTDVAYFTRFCGWELARFELPAAATAAGLARRLSGSWSAAELPHRCSQMYIERILRDEAARLPSVALRFGWRVVDFAASADRVEVTAVSPEGAPARFAGRYLVGCDGPRSEIRRRLGFAMEGEAGRARHYMGGRTHAIHLRAPGLYAMLPHKRSWQYIAVNAERRGVMLALDGRQEFVFHGQLKAEEEEKEVSDAFARALFHQALGRQADFEILSRGTWMAGLTLVAERFQDGRVLLAGDAVHLFTPTGGLGYNTAVEDAVNLGWKLAATLAGWGGPDLLSSYEAERAPVARRNTGFARAFADSVGLIEAPPALEAKGPSGEAARRDVGERLNRHARAEFDIPGITFGARYDGSPIIVPDGTDPPPDEPNRYRPTACPGGRAPHAWLADGRSLYDAFGFGFTVLRLGTRAPDPAPLLRAARARSMPVSLLVLPDEALRDLYEADLAIVRPDQIVAWRGHEVPADPDAVLAQICGHAAARSVRASRPPGR